MMPTEDSSDHVGMMVELGFVSSRKTTLGPLSSAPEYDYALQDRAYLQMIGLVSMPAPRSALITRTALAADVAFF